MPGVVDIARQAVSLRVSRFALVGAGCAVFQFAVNFMLRDLGVASVAAFALSFVVSAQLNFVLSDRFTWGSRRRHAGPHGKTVTRWARYNVSTLAALGISSATFAFAIHFVGNGVAVCCGTKRRVLCSPSSPVIGWCSPDRRAWLYPPLRRRWASGRLADRDTRRDGDPLQVYRCRLRRR